MTARVFQHEIELFRRHGGGLRMADALRLGINRNTLYAMRDAHVVEPISRGLYRLASLDPLTHPDLVTVALRVPQGVLCLISALSFHELTTQVPHAIDVALERGKTKPRLDYPPTRFVWFSGPAFHDGIETHKLDGVARTHLRPGEDARRHLPVPEPDRHGRERWRRCGCGASAARGSSTCS
jgi:hypothetical protein